MNIGVENCTELSSLVAFFNKSTGVSYDLKSNCNINGVLYGNICYECPLFT